MSGSVAGSGLRVDVARWPGFHLPRGEVVGALWFLAYRCGRAVRCGPFRGGLPYAADRVQVCMATGGTCRGPVPVPEVRLDGRTYPLDAAQCTFESVRDVGGEKIEDDEGRVLARVDHNCIVVLIDVTAADNAGGRAVLSHVVERAASLLDFDVADLLDRRRAEVSEQYEAFHRSALRSRIEAKSEEVRRLGREETDLYYRLVAVGRELPLARQELEVLEDLAESTVPAVVEKQTEGLAGLLAAGRYEEIAPHADGTLFARTAPVVIEHDDWVFDLGRYEVGIDATGRVTIASADGADGDGYPHPHVDSSGRPCLGNIAPDLAKAVGAMRLFEALTLLADFLESYNEEGPFVRIERFDPECPDYDENPCESCEDYRTPYCVVECRHNDGTYCCADCCEYRTDYCYTECRYNVPGFPYVSPCDDCEEGEAYCFLECPYNAEWQVNGPCGECERPSCEGCPYEAKKRQLESAAA